MPVTNYYTVDGEIIGESRGGVEINYAKDALGSVVGTLVGDTLQNTYALYLLPETDSSVYPEGIGARERLACQRG